MARDQTMDAPAKVREHSTLTLVHYAYRRFTRIHGHIYAAAMSYFVLFSLFPWMIFLVTLLTLVVRDPAVQAQVINQIVDQFPPGARIRVEIRSFVAEITMRRSGLLGVIGLISTVIIASEAFRSLRYALNALFDVTQARSLIRGRAIDLLGMFVVLIFGLISAGLSTILADGWLREQVNVDTTAGLVLVGTIQFLLPFLLAFIAFTLMYRVVPEVKLTWRILWIPGIIAAVGFELSKIGMGLFITHFTRFQQLYGTLSVAVVFLVFVFFVANIVLLAGALAAEINRSSNADHQHRKSADS